MKEQNFWFYNMVGSIIWAASINLLGIFFIDNYQVILDNLGKVMTVFLVGTIAYFYFFKKEFIKTYMRDKQNEINERIEKERVRKENK
jgi:membrane protein DedA with SNARE-associated domain